jgi:hypothetical protein
LRGGETVRRSCGGMSLHFLQNCSNFLAGVRGGGVHLAAGFVDGFAGGHFSAHELSQLRVLLKSVVFRVAILFSWSIIP